MTSTAIKTLGKFTPKTIFDSGLGALLPQAYRKFYKEWKETQPTAVHYVPEKGKWRRDDVTGEVHPIQNVPIPLIFPRESNDHLWGGEGIIQGFKEPGDYRRVPHFWIPTLKRSVVRTEVLDKHISVIVTERTIQLINTNYGFDHYLLKTPACDLRSLLALTLKRKILQELEQNCPIYNDRPERQKEILTEYKKYLDGYTSEEIDWYGYSFSAACRKMQGILDGQKKIVPLKQIYRAKLIEKLREGGIQETMETNTDLGQSTSWLQKLNPFGKKQET